MATSFSAGREWLFAQVPARTLHTSSPLANLGWLLGTRVLSLAFLLFALVADLTLYDYPERWPFYLTNWAFTAALLYFALAVYLAIKEARLRSTVDESLTKHTTHWSFAHFWALFAFECALVFSVLVTVLHWTTPFGRRYKSLAHILMDDWRSELTRATSYGITTGLLLLDAWLSHLVLVPFHVVVPLALGTGFIIVNIVYTSAMKTVYTPKSDVALVDAADVWQAVWLCAGCAAGVLAAHLLACGMLWAKARLLRRCFAQRAQLPIHLGDGVETFDPAEFYRLDVCCAVSGSASKATEAAAEAAEAAAPAAHDERDDLHGDSDTGAPTAGAA